MKLLKLNHYQQMTEYTCGPATLLTFLDYHDKKLCRKLSEKKLEKILRTCPKIGTTPDKMLGFLQQTGKTFELQKKVHLSHLEKSINAEKPSIVLWLSDDEWHWSTLVGYDKEM